MFNNNRNDLYKKMEFVKLDEGITIKRYIEGYFNYNFIYYSNTFRASKIIESLNKEVDFFLKKFKIKSLKHILIVGLGSSKNTSDSIGIEVLNKIKATYHLKKLGISLKKYVSTLKTGVLGETGIDSKRVVESVVDEIKPDLVILIDSFVTANVEELNHIIELTDSGIVPGSGVMGINEKIDKNSIGVPVIAIGVPTAVEVNINSYTYLLSTSDVDIYIDEVSSIIATSINKLFVNIT